MSKAKTAFINIFGCVTYHQAVFFPIVTFLTAPCKLKRILKITKLKT